MANMKSRAPGLGTRLLRLFCVFHCARFANDIDFDLSGIVQIFLDLAGNAVRQNDQLIVGNSLRLDHDAHFAAGLDGKAAFHAFEAVRNFFQRFQTFDVALQILTPCTGRLR